MADSVPQLMPQGGWAWKAALRRLLVLPLMVVLLFPAAANARPLAQYQHRAFGTADGMPDEILSIAQTRDGAIWLGAPTGVYTFDGLRVVRYPVAFRDTLREPYFLRGDGEGGIWIGWKRGGISYVRQGAIRHYDVGDGIPTGTIWGFAFDRGGRVWAAGINGIARFDGKRWQRIGASEGFDAASAAAVVVDGDGNVGVFTERGLYVWRHGARRFDRPIGNTATRQPPTIGPQGELYFMDKRGIRRIASLDRYDRQDFPWLYREQEETGSFLADRDGGIWFDSTSGLHHLARPADAQPLHGPLRADTETITRKDGLSGRVVSCMFEDDRGDVWVATEAGLDRFRPTELVNVGPPEGFEAAGNSIVANAETGKLWRYAFFPRYAWLQTEADGTVRERYVGDYTSPGTSDGAGLLTVESQKHVVLLGSGRRQVIGPELPHGHVNAIARDAAGQVWVAFSNGIIVHGDGGAWKNEDRLPEGLVTALYPDADGAVWIGYEDNRLIRWNNGNITGFGAGQGLSTGAVSSIKRMDRTLWVAGRRGLNVLHGARLERIDSESDPLDDLADMAVDRQGALWLTGRAGLLYVPASQLRACLRDGARKIAPRRYDGADGLRGSRLGTSHSQLAVDALGNLWAGTTLGVYRIDTRRVRVPPAPRAIVTGLKAGAVHYDPAPALRLPASARDIQIDYTAPVPDTPERVRFRYRLVGHDRGWQTAGARRQAFYTGLAPGIYRFEVAAAQEDSGWSATPDGVAFEIPPAWHQTLWFRTVCVVALLSALTAAYLLRVRSLARRIEAQAAARQDERERIARDLHDTLLQTNYALLLQIQAVATNAGDDPLARKLDAIVKQAYASLNVGRDKVSFLRARQGLEAGFQSILEQSVQGLLQGTDIALRFQVRGHPWSLNERTAAECHAIVCEAVNNTRKHARASHVRVEIAYGIWTMDIAVADDGCGIDPRYAGGRPGHWGLAGMRERAASIGARLDIRSNGRGTAIRLRVARRHALAWKLGRAS